MANNKVNICIDGRELTVRADEIFKEPPKGALCDVCGQEACLTLNIEIEEVEIDHSRSSGELTDQIRGLASSAVKAILQHGKSNCKNEQCGETICDWQFQAAAEQNAHLEITL